MTYHEAINAAMRQAEDSMEFRYVVTWDNREDERRRSVCTYRGTYGPEAEAFRLTVEAVVSPEGDVEQESHPDPEAV